jgi:hypothetical protein
MAKFPNTKMVNATNSLQRTEPKGRKKDVTLVKPVHDLFLNHTLQISKASMSNSVEVIPG